MLNPLLGEVIVITEIVVALMVIAVAPFGSQALGERAFRLRWFGNGPEPPAPNWVITRCVTRSPVSSAQLKVSHRELAAVGEMGVPINVGSWRVRRVIQDESCPWDYPVSGNVGIRARGC